MAHDAPLLVIGHKNPDTDSVCAAIAFARYKTDVEKMLARPMRAGNVNAQTRFALESFGAEVPELLADVFPRIRDIMIGAKDLILLDPGDPVADARSLMLGNRFSFLPVADRDQRCLGRLTALRLAALLDEVDPTAAGEEITLHLATMVELGGPKSALLDASRQSAPTVTGRVVAAGSQPKNSSRKGKSRDPRILVGSAADIVRDDGVGAVLAVAAECAAGTEQRDSLAEWSARTAVPALALAAPLLRAGAIVRLARPISSCLEPTGPAFREDTTLREALREVNKSNEGGFVVLDAKDRICGVVTRINFMTDARFRVALVDHNELSQAVEGMEHANIIEIIDHHRIGGRSTSEPITFVNRAVGSTCTIVSDLYRRSGVRPSRDTAGLLLSGVLSDTVLLRSPTSTPADEEVVRWLAPIAEVDAEQYGERMFEAGSEMQSLGAREIIERDMKYYEEEKVQFSVSQMEMTGFKVFWDRSEELRNEVAAHRTRSGLSFACLMVTDITHGTTLLVTAGEDRIIREIAYPRAADDVFEMKGVLSRKKQVLPYLAEIVRGL